jgi:hypothetical protein
MSDFAVLQETRANRDLFARVLIGEIDAVVAPLLRLDERTRASIIALVGAAQLITAYERSVHHPHEAVGNDFDAILYGLHPDGAALLAGLRTTGLAESVAYGWTLALCRGERDNEGTSRAARAAAAEVACAMSHLDALLDVLKRLRLPAHVASDRPHPAQTELADFPHGWEPACHDM